MLREHAGNGAVPPHCQARGGTAVPHSGAAGRGDCPQQEALTPAAARFQQLLEGLDVPGDSGNPPVAPPWLDRALFNKGRQFYERYLFCVFLSDLMGLLLMFSVGRILRPLMYTGRSSTPFRALRRYVSTIGHVITWYSGDVWEPSDAAHQDVLAVRRIHNAAATTFNSSQHRAGVDAATATPRGGQAPACPFAASVRQDLRECVGGGPGLEEQPALYISQWDHMFTQYGFLGVMVAHPWQVGAWWVTEEEMAGFIHFWRGLGWLLGIRDEYNFCSGSVEETRALCREIEHRVVRPCLAQAGADHELMGTALMEGLSSVLPWFSYPAMMSILGDTLDIPMPAVNARMSVRHKVQYVFLRVLMRGLFLVPGVARLCNELLKVCLRVVQGRHPTWKPKVTVTPYTY